MIPPNGHNDEQLGQPGGREPAGGLAPIIPAASDLLAAAPAGPGGPPRTGSLRALLRFKGTILIVSLLLAGPALALIWRYSEPVYTASGQIRVRPIVPHLVFRTEDNGAVPYYQNYLNTQVALVTSPTVLQRALTQPDVQATAWYRDAPQSQSLFGPKSRLEKLREQLEVTPRPRTEVIDVHVEAGSGADAAVLVNAVLDQYIRHSQELSNEGADRIYQQLTHEYEQLKHQLRQKEQAIEHLHRRLGTTDPQQLIAEQRGRLDTMENEFDNVQRAQAVARWRVERMNRTGSPPPTTAPADTAAYQQDGEWWRLKEDVARLDMTLDAERERLGPMHPKIRDLFRRRQFAAEMVAARERVLNQNGGVIDTAGVFLANPLQSAQDELSLSSYQAQLYTDSLARQKQAWEKTFDGAELLSQQLAELRDVRELYEAVRARLESKRMERNVPGSIEVLARAVEPQSISKDRRWAYSALAVFGAVAIGLMVAGVRASTGHPLVDSAMLPAAPVGPFVGMLPLVRTSRCLPLRNQQLNERIRTVRTVLLQRVDRGEGNVVMLTSASPREGKTTTGVMLARSLAQCGKRVLLVDGDAQNPQVAETLGLKGPPGGFQAALAQGRSLHEAVMDTPVPRLRIAPGTIVHSTEESDAFGNSALATALESWRNEYDIVLIDTPPVLSSADALILAPLVSGAVFVVRLEQTRTDAMREALSYLTSVGGKVWATVVIGQECACAGAFSGSNGSN